MTHRLVTLTFCQGGGERARSATCPFTETEPHHGTSRHVVGVCTCGVFYGWPPQDEEARERVLADVRAADAAGLGREGHAMWAAHQRARLTTV